MPIRTKFFGSVALILALSISGAAQKARPSAEAKRTTAEWLRLLKSEDGPREDWAKAREALGPDGSHVKEAIPALFGALGDPREPANARVARALSDHGPVVVPELVRMLKQPTAGVRAGAAMTLGHVRPRPTDAV